MWKILETNQLFTYFFVRSQYYDAPFFTSYFQLTYSSYFIFQSPFCRSLDYNLDKMKQRTCLNLLIFLSMTLQLYFRIYWVFAEVFNRFYCSHKYTQLLLTGDNDLVNVNRWFSASTYMKLVAVCETCFHGQKAMTSPDESWHFYRRLFSPLCLHTVPIEAFQRAPSPSIRQSSLCAKRGADGTPFLM